MLLRYSLGMSDAADAIAKAVGDVLDQGLRTADILPQGMSDGMTKVTTSEMGDAVLKALG
jgi:3-isopropylmalate dehydrogenase